MPITTISPTAPPSCRQREGTFLPFCSSLILSHDRGRVWYALGMACSACDPTCFACSKGKTLFMFMHAPWPLIPLSLAPPPLHSSSMFSLLTFLFPISPLLHWPLQSTQTIFLLQLRLHPLIMPPKHFRPSAHQQLLARPMTDAYVIQAEESPFSIMGKPSSCHQGIAWH